MAGFINHNFINLCNTFLSEFQSQINIPIKKINTTTGSIPEQICYQFDNIVNTFRDKYMSINPRLDRHKLSSCLCFAALYISPFEISKEQKDEKMPVYSRFANEMFSFMLGYTIIKLYMLYDVNNMTDDKEKREELTEKINLIFPYIPQNTTSNNSYLLNICYALANVAKNDSYNESTIFMSIIYYHLEMEYKNQFNLFN